MSEIVLAEPVIGHRYWTLDIDRMQLNGMAGNPWLTGEMEAVCNKGRHDAPDWTATALSEADLERLLGVPLPVWIDPAKGYGDWCMCGINAYKLTHPVDFHETMVKPESIAVGVHGVVELGGRVVEYERGYRAQYGLIREATLITRQQFGGRFLGYLEDKYECPFRTLTASEWRKEWEATYGRDWGTEKEDRDAETAAPPGTGKTTNALGTLTGDSWQSIQDSARAALEAYGPGSLLTPMGGRMPPPPPSPAWGADPRWRYHDDDDLTAWDRLGLAIAILVVMAFGFWLGVMA